MVTMKPAANPTTHPSEAGRVSTMELILSVTVANVYPGSMTGARLFATSTSFRLSAIFSLPGFRPVLRLSFQFRVGVANLSQIGGARPGIQVGQQPVIEIQRLELRHPAVGIVDVAKDNRIGRAGLLAGRLQGSVFNLELAIFAHRRRFGVNAMLGNALHAIRALFHDAAAAHGDVGIAHQLILRSLPVLEQQEVETPRSEE